MFSRVINKHQNVRINDSTFRKTKHLKKDLGRLYLDDI